MYYDDDNYCSIVILLGGSIFLCSATGLCRCYFSVLNVWNNLNRRIAASNASNANATKNRVLKHVAVEAVPIGSMYAIYGNICHQYTPNASIYIYHTWILWVQLNTSLNRVNPPDPAAWKRYSSGQRERTSSRYLAFQHASPTNTPTWCLFPLTSNY